MDQGPLLHPSPFVEDGTWRMVHDHGDPKSRKDRWAPWLPFRAHDFFLRPQQQIVRMPCGKLPSWERITHITLRKEENHRLKSDHFFGGDMLVPRRVTL